VIELPFDFDVAWLGVAAVVCAIVAVAALEEVRRPGTTTSADGAASILAVAALGFALACLSLLLIAAGVVR
jgi:hypothetical protein